MNQTEIDPNAGAFVRLLQLVSGFALMGLSVLWFPDGMPMALAGYVLYEMGCKDVNR